MRSIGNLILTSGDNGRPRLNRGISRFSFPNATPTGLDSFKAIFSNAISPLQGLIC
jgi:hypothetical protein